MREDEVPELVPRLTRETPIAHFTQPVAPYRPLSCYYYLYTGQFYRLGLPPDFFGKDTLRITKIKIHKFSTYTHTIFLLNFQLYF